MSWEESPNLGGAECEREGCTSRVFLYYKLCPEHFFALPKDVQIELGKDLVEYPCTVEGCGQEQVAHDLCSKHYQQRRRGTLGVQREGKRVCSVESCEEPHTAKGYCLKHYQAVRRALAEATPRRSKETTQAECMWGECARPAVALGLCSKHYQQHRRGTIGARREVARVCSVESCDRPHAAKGYCSKHYQQYRQGTLGRETTQAECMWGECDRPAKVKGLCPKHYQRVLRASV